jgi:enoyl-CoA hydratase
MSYQTLLYAVTGNVATVTINRPEKLNALNATAKAELLEVFTTIQNDPAVRVTIITGAGEKAFVAGTDIEELTMLNRQSGKEFAAGGQAIFDFIENHGKPVIAAVNGYALGGGCELALACHIRVASERARFGQPEVNLGAIPGYGGTQRLARLVGKGKALEMILTGLHIDAQEALRTGLANAVVPREKLITTAQGMAETIAAKPGEAIRLALQAILATAEKPLSDGTALEAILFGACCETHDFKEGTTAFLGKRKPEFKHH